MPTEGGCKQRRGQAITTRYGLKRSPVAWNPDNRGGSQRMAVGKAAMACVSLPLATEKSRPGRLAGRSMPRCCCHVLHATERARHSRSSVGIPRHSLQLPCETTQSLVESNTQSLPNCKPRIEQVLRRNGKGMSERPSRNERSEPGPLTARASKDDQRRCLGAGCGQGQMTLWPSG